MHTVILFLTGLLAILLVWQAFRRPDRRRLAWRLAASLLVTGALALLATNPAYRVPVDPKQAILLTEGASEDTLQALLQALPAEPTLWAADSAAFEQFTRFNVQILPDPGYLRRRHPEVQTVHILGYGLPPYDLPLLDSVRAIPHLSAPDNGLIAVRWTEKVPVGEPVVLQGSYHNRSDQPTQLRLVGFGAGVDSTEIRGGQRSHFELRATPKEKDRFVFTLQGRANNELTFTEKIPFEVVPRPLLRVLILEAFPTFQSKFLKAFLAREGHTVAARAAISQGKYQTEFLNTPPLSLKGLTPALLGRFDLLLTDAASLSAFTSTEQTELRNAVQAGLGVLVLASEEELPRDDLWTGFALQTAPGPDIQRIKPEWPTSPGGTPAITIPAIHLRSTPTVKPLVTAEQQRMVAGTQPYGLGRTAVVVAGNTFEWTLAGKPAVYAAYWSYLLTATARRAERPENWRTPFLPVVGQPVSLQVTSEVNAPPLLAVDSTTIYPQEVVSGSRQWESTFWPRQGGWQAANTPQGEPYHWYVYEKSDWRSQQQRQRYEATVAYLNRPLQQGIDGADGGVVRQERVPAIWFYLLFLLGAGYLWLERKL